MGDVNLGLKPQFQPQSKAPQAAPRKWSVDIRSHHALCEINFHRLLCLLPDMRNGVESWNFVVGEAAGKLQVCVKLLDEAPYTTTVEVEQSRHWGDCILNDILPSARIILRLYHDVRMAEIIAWDQHKQWLPEYHYPNAQMYQPDEKVALNQFLGEWLCFCNKHGVSTGDTVTRFS